MEFIVFDDGLVFIVVFADTVHSSHELLILIYDCHFLVLDCFWTDLILHDVVYVPEVVDVLGVEILMVQGVIDEDLERGLLTEGTIVKRLLTKCVLDNRGVYIAEIELFFRGSFSH